MKAASRARHPTRLAPPTLCCHHYCLRPPSLSSCFAHDDLLGRFVAMRDALNASGRPIVYMLCEWVRAEAGAGAGLNACMWKK